MSERPIIFSAPMVRAILAGRKTQTRRIAKLNASGRVKEPGSPRNWHCDDPEATLACPYGQPGDTLWVRETCHAHELTDVEAYEDTFGVMERRGLEVPPYGLDGVVYAADDHFREIENSIAASERWGVLNAYGNKQGATVPAIHMPRWASRITLGIAAVRLQRLQAITEADVRSEGCAHGQAFTDLWNDINGAHSWDRNPWVWAITFRHTVNVGVARNE